MVSIMKELGKESNLTNDIYPLVEKRGTNLRPNWKARVRATLEENSSDTDAWNQKYDLFSNKAKGEGNWILRDLDKTSIDERINLKEGLDYEIPEYKPQIKERKERVYSPKKSKSNNKNIIPTKPSKKVGRAGEEHVYKYEYKKLVDQNREDLAKKIVKQYEDLTSFPGYDIISFNKDGKEIYIEVKSTVSKGKDYFEITENEILAAKSLKESYFIYQVTDALVSPKISAKVKNPIKYVEENKILLEPWIYKMFIH